MGKVEIKFKCDERLERNREEILIEKTALIKAQAPYNCIYFMLMQVGGNDARSIPATVEALQGKVVRNKRGLDELWWVFSVRLKRIENLFL